MHSALSRANVPLFTQEKYLNHVKKFGEELNLTVTSCFLSLPIVALLWSIVSFTIAVGAFCFQDSDSSGKFLLIVILGVMGICCCCIVFFFWHIWRDPRQNEIDNPQPNVGWSEPISLTWQEKFQKWRRNLRKLKRGDIKDKGKKRAQV
jgi:hypothetical protein